jgi:hypothetical protein
MMRKWFWFAVVFALILPLVAQAESKTYGEGVTMTETTKVSDILATPEAYVGKTVAVEGIVVEVCKKRGCWLELGSDKPYEFIKVKVRDGVMVFPMSARGRTAQVQGVVEALEMTKEEAIARGKHHAEEQGTTFDPASITGPQKSYRIRGTGAQIL